MQQVVLCSDWCALEVLPNPSTHTEEHVIVVYPSTGKPSALKGACSVWTGGKSVSSYLSVFFAKIYRLLMIDFRKDPDPTSYSGEVGTRAKAVWSAAAH